MYLFNFRLLSFLRLCPLFPLTLLSNYFSKRDNTCNAIKHAECIFIFIMHITKVNACKIWWKMLSKWKNAKCWYLQNWTRTKSKVVVDSLTLHWCSYKPCSHGKKDHLFESVKVFVKRYKTLKKSLWFVWETQIFLQKGDSFCLWEPCY